MLAEAAGRWLLVSALFAQTACGAADPAPGEVEDTAGAAGSGGSNAGGQGGSAGQAAGGSSGASGGTGGVDRPAREESVQIDQSFWRAGWKVTLGEARLKVEAGSSYGKVTIDAELENLGNDSATFNSQLLLTDGTADHVMSADAGSSAVLAGRAKNATLTVQVDREFSLELATLIVGNPQNHLAVVPIGAHSPDELISLEPLDLDAPGSLAVGAVTFAIEGGSVRADDLTYYDEFDTEHLLLSLDFSLTRTGYLGPAEQVVSERNLQLRTPDGTLVAPDNLWSELLAQTGATVDGLVVDFVVPTPAKGKYALVAKGYWTDDGTTNNDWIDGELSFEVPELANFAEE